MKLPRLREEIENGELSSVAVSVNRIASSVEEHRDAILKLQEMQARNEMCLIVVTNKLDSLQFWTRFLVATAVTSTLGALGTLVWYVLAHAR